MKVSKFGLVGFAVSALLCAFSIWSAIYTADPETRVKAVFNAVTTGVFAVFFLWCLVEDIRQHRWLVRRDVELTRSHPKSFALVTESRSIAVDETPVWYGFTDPTPCPWCGYGPVSVSQWGFCPDCGQPVYPHDVANAQAHSKGQEGQDGQG